MNWYEKTKLQKIAFRNSIDLAANKLSKKIFSAIVKLYEENRLFLQDNRQESIHVKYPKFEDILECRMNIDIFRQYISQKPFFVDARYLSKQPNMYTIYKNPFSGSTNRTMIINIKIAQNFSSKNFNEFYFDIVGAVRHELAHMEQDQERMMLKYMHDYDPKILLEQNNPIQKFTEAAKYMSSALEQKPFIKGFMLQCKKNKKPLVEELKKLIHNNLFTSNKAIEKAIKKHYGLMAEHIELQLIDLYLKEAKKMFPNINIENIS